MASELDMDVIKPWCPIDESTVRPVGEGVWFAWRVLDRPHMMGNVCNGLWWLADGSKVVSLAAGTGLHAHRGYDWETYVFRPDGVDIDVCCHDTEEAAERCALIFFATGRWCYESSGGEGDGTE